MSDSGSMIEGNGNASRHEKSLGLLTTRFVSLLQDAKDGVLDLKVVSCSPDLLFLQMQFLLSSPLSKDLQRSSLTFCFGFSIVMSPNGFHR